MIVDIDIIGCAPVLCPHGFCWRNCVIQGMEDGKEIEITVVLSAKGCPVRC